MNDLIVNGNANLPAHAQAEGSSNLAGDLIGAGFNRLSFKGNRFHVKIGGEDRVLGTTELRVIILEANPHVSRLYYAVKWDGETATRPDCASEDGVKPLATVAEPQSSACNTCPMNEKGSSISDTGGKTRACSFYKRVVVMLVDEPNLGPLVADMKAMSMFGQSYADKGLFSLRDYAKRLDQNKVMPYAVVTTLEFDTNESVPKVLFRATDYTSAEFHNQHVQPLLDEGDLPDLARTNDINTSGDAEATPPADGLLGGPAPTHATEAVEKHGTDTPPEPEEEELTPAQKAAITRAKNKAAKEAEEKKAAEAAAAGAEKAAEVEAAADTTPAFDDDLEAALAEFDFD